MGFEENQSYQRFADSQQEVFNKKLLHPLIRENTNVYFIKSQE